MCGARQIWTLPYSDHFSPASKTNTSKVVMQFTSRMTQKLQDIRPLRASTLACPDKNTPPLRTADTFKVLCSAASQRYRKAVLFSVMP